MLRRLGARPQRPTRDASEVFAITLLVIVWAALYRILVIFQGILDPYGFDRGWFSADTGSLPLLCVFALLLGGASAINAGLLLAPESRTRSGLALTALNAAFVGVFGCALALHAQFADDLTAHRRSGARSYANLENDVAGDWEVAEFQPAAVVSLYPARGLRFERSGRVQFLRHIAPEIEISWWEPVPTDDFRAERFAFAGRCGLWTCAHEPVTEKWPPRRSEWPTAVQPPAIWLIAVLRSPAARSLPEPIEAWAAEIPRPEPNELVFRSLRMRGDPRPVASVRLERVSSPRAGWDLGAELASIVSGHDHANEGEP